MSKRNSQDVNKDEQQLEQTHPNDIVEVTKYDTDIPHERIFFGKVRYGSSSEKKVSAGKICLYVRIHFTRRVTAVNKKDQGKKANVFKAILEYMANGEQGDKEKLQDDIEKLLAVLLKSYPQEFIKTCIEKAGFKFMRNIEVHEAVQLKLLLNLPLNAHKKNVENHDTIWI